MATKQQFESVLQKQLMWYFPLNASYPAFLNNLLDDWIGINPLYNPEQRHNFVQQVFLSLSLSIEEKNRVLREYSRLVMHQLERFDEVFTEEQEEFKKFEKEHPEKISDLVTKAGIDWLFIIPNIKLNHAILDWIYRGSRDSVGYCLEHLYKYNKVDEYIDVFEMMQAEASLTEDHWNNYMNYIAVKDPGKLSTLVLDENASVFLRACKVSYLLKEQYFENLSQSELKEFFSIIRQTNDKQVRAQFVSDLIYYYYYKTGDFKKFVYRIVSLFIKSQEAMTYESEKQLIWLEKSYSYLTVLTLFIDKSTIAKILDDLLIKLTKLIDLIEEEKSEAEKMQKYIDFAPSIISLATTFFVDPKFHFHFLRIINKTPSLKDHMHPRHKLIMQLLYCSGSNDTKQQITHALHLDTFSVNSIASTYIILVKNAKKVVAEQLLQEYQRVNKERESVIEQLAELSNAAYHESINIELTRKLESVFEHAPDATSSEVDKLEHAK